MLAAVPSVVLGPASVLGSLAFAGGESKRVAGFGLLPGFIVEQKDRLEGAIKDQPAFVGLRLEEGSAIVVRRRNARVIGGSNVATVFPGKGGGKPAAEAYQAGSLLDLVQLRRAAANRAAKEPFPPAKPPVPDVKKGSLVIVGGGGATTEIWKRFIATRGRAGCYSSSSSRPRWKTRSLPESIEEKVLRRNGAKNVKSLHTRDRKEADDPKFSEVLTKAKGVWFSRRAAVAVRRFL